MFDKILRLGVHRHSSRTNRHREEPTHIITFKSRTNSVISESTVRESIVPDELIASLVLNSTDAAKHCAIAEKITYQQAAFMNNLKRAEVYIPVEADINWELTDIDAWIAHTETEYEETM
jgi:hypothetical protein